MLRFAEFGLFLLPFAVYAAWRFLGVRASARVVWAAVAIFVSLVVAVVWYGLNARLDRGETYVPAHLQDGRIVPGHGVAKTGAS
jgi:4-amino-4-deoxy-L-arabinose transferase-like glycosyltransferase